MSASRLLRLLWALAIAFAVVYGGSLHRTAQLEADGRWAPLTAPLASAAESLGFDARVDAWADARDRFYDEAPTLGAIAAPAPPPRPPAPAPTPRVERAPLVDGFAQAPVIDPDSTSDDYAPLRPAPRRILIVGASSIQFEFGRGLEHGFEALEGVEVRRWGRHSTGLSRLDYFDWFERGAELADEFQPDLVIAQVGGNDCQVITDHDADPVALFPDEEAWSDAYGQRVREFVEVFRSRGARVVVLGMPIMRSPSFRQKMERLNAVVEAAVQSEGEIFLSTWGWTSDESGAYTAVLEIDGDDEVIRADDGIHMSVIGAEYLAARVIEALRDPFALPEPAAE